MDITNYTSAIQSVSITKAYSDFSTAATTNTINLMNLPAQASLVSITAETTVPFRWAGNGTITLSTTSNWLSYTPLETGIGEIQSKWVDPPYFNSATSAFTVQATMTSTDSNLTSLTTGSFEFTIQYLLYT